MQLNDYKFSDMFVLSDLSYTGYKIYASLFPQEKIHDIYTVYLLIIKFKAKIQGLTTKRVFYALIDLKESIVSFTMV